MGRRSKNDETWTIPPGSGSVIEAVFPEEGIYVGVDHAMNDVVKGAAFAVLATPDATNDDHPPGTMVPPRGSEMVTGPTTFEEGEPAAAEPDAISPPPGNATATGNETATAGVNQTSPNQTSSGNSTG